MSPMAARARKRTIAKLLGAVGSVVAITALGAVASCSRSADPVPLRTFDRAQNIDVVCLRVLKDDGTALVPPVPLPQGECSANPPSVSGGFLPNHLFGLVTQTARGEVAVVDLTGGRIVDSDHSTPGVNFLPVGMLPTDIASSPDGKMTFVASGEPDKWAIYALPSVAGAGQRANIFGDEYALAIPQITDWPSCALPQAPAGLAIVPRAVAPVSTGSTGDAGTDSGDAGTPPAAGNPGYDLVAVLPGTGRTPTKVIVVNVQPFLRGAGLDTSEGERVAPGSLAQCPYIVAAELTADMPDEAPLGARWSDGVAYVDGGVTLPAPAGVACSSVAPTGTGAADAGDAGGDAAADAGTIPMPKVPGDVPRAVSIARDDTTLYLADEQLPLIHVLDLSNPTAPRELAPLLATSIATARRVSVGALAVSPATRDAKRFLYAVDRSDGSLMVYDVTGVRDGAAYPRVPMRRPHPELNPFQPADRITFGTSVTGVTFVRHDWPILRDQGAPINAARTGLLCNPNPNVNAPNGSTQSRRDVTPETPFRDPGAYYRENAPSGSGLEVGLGPLRLRGVFGFATLASGQMAIIDVDDWDAPCRRPDPMGVYSDASGKEIGPTAAPSESVPALSTPIFSLADPSGAKRTRGISDLAPLMPAPTSDDDLDPYHAPIAFYTNANGAFVSAVTNEGFFPVSAPHRSRSFYMLRSDQTSGNHLPHLPGLAQLRYKNVPINAVGPNAVENPLMLPTFSALPDPAQIKYSNEPNPRLRELLQKGDAQKYPHLPLSGINADVRFSFEDPEVHADQDWSIKFEGELPGFDQVAMTMSREKKAYESLRLSVNGAHLCRRGILDHEAGVSRAQQIVQAFSAAGQTSAGVPALTPPTRIDHRLGDYVQIIDEIVAVDDPYWSTNEPPTDPDDACWDGNTSNAQQRYDVCARTFGAAGDENVSRDFPILEAHDDHLVIGRYGYPDPTAPITETREVVGADASNVPFLKLARCCFHRQAHVKVRAGAEWVAVGSISGFLHSVVADEGGRCRNSCAPEDVLMSGRAPMIPRPELIDPGPKPKREDFKSDAEFDAAVADWTPKNDIWQLRSHLDSHLDRNSPLAFRNPMFSVLMWNQASERGSDGTPKRDFEWAFATRGQFTPMMINLAARTVSVAPRTLRYIEALRQLAVVDSSLQGLQLFDLRTLAAVRDPYL